jgi:hypothetical protein
MIPQITIMAAITLTVSVIFWGGLIFLFSGRQKRYFWLLLLGLPFSAIANLYIKQQVIVLVGLSAHVPPYLGLAAPAWFLAFKVLVTPLVEEPIKVLPLLLPPVWKMVTSRTGALWTGFTLGVSFGLGEAAYIAYAIARVPEYAALPWYAYTGYMSERIFACFAHGVLTAVLVTGIQRRGRFLLAGLLAALGLHVFLNAPAALYQLKLIPLELYNFSLVIPFIVLAVVFERMRRAARGSQDDRSSREVVYWKRHGSGPAEWKR